MTARAGVRLVADGQLCGAERRPQREHSESWAGLEFGTWAIEALDEPRPVALTKRWMFQGDGVGKKG